MDILGQGPNRGEIPRVFAMIVAWRGVEDRFLIAAIVTRSKSGAAESGYKEE
jgi:hypothetical protein